MPRTREDFDDDSDEHEWSLEDEVYPMIACPHCKETIPEDAPHCPYCERYISEEDTQQAPTQPNWVKGVALFLVVLFLLTFLSQL